MTDTDPTAHWYCLRSQPKRERIAASQLRLLPEVEVFLPLVKYTTNSKKGKHTAIEAMFPNYLFARFHPVKQRAVGYAKGVSYIIKCGEALQVVDSHIISELRSVTVEDYLELKPEPFRIGDNVTIIRGIFSDSTATITQLKPAAERVVVLMEILGRPMEIELPSDTLKQEIVR